MAKNATPGATIEFDGQILYVLCAAISDKPHTYFIGGEQTGIVTPRMSPSEFPTIGWHCQNLETGALLTVPKGKHVIVGARVESLELFAA